MKKVLPIVVLLLVSGAAAFFFLQRQQTASRVRAIALAPEDTLVFVHLPDLRQSAIRWPRTALAQIGKEPEVQAFLERPRAKMSWFSQLDTRLEQVMRAAPREAYLAVTSLEGQKPRFVGGFSFTGDRAVVNELLAEARTSLRREWPTGKADIVSYAGTEIETYSDKENTIAEAIRDGWYLVSNDLALLHSTLDRLDAKPGAAASVANSSLYQEALKPHPADAEAVVFARLDTLADSLEPMLVAAGQPSASKQIEELRKTKAISAAFKFDGEQIRDTVFVLNPSVPQRSPMALRGLDLSTAETLLYYSVTLPETTDVPAESMVALSMVVPGMAALEGGLAKKGLKLSDFGKIFGPELSVVLDWPQTEMQPTLLLGLDVRDATRARDFLDAATVGEANLAGWVRTEQGNAVLYAGKPQGLFPAPVMALADNFLVIGLSQAAITTGVQRLQAKGAPLAQTAEYQAARKAVRAPTAAFGYLDTKRIFERGYGIGRPFLAMSLAFNPDGSQYVDAGKLPTTEVVSRHLTPSVYSQTTLENGTLIESAGTLTFNQALIGVVAGAGVAALPTLKQALPNATGLPGGVTPPDVPVQPSAPADPAVPAPEASPESSSEIPVQAAISEVP